jgi:hypothetical protein
MNLEKWVKDLSEELQAHGYNVRVKMMKYKR